MTTKRKILIAIVALLAIAGITLSIIITPEIEMKNKGSRKFLLQLPL